MVEIHRQGPGWQLVAEQLLPAPLSGVFSFFSQPEGLDEITPPWLSFQIEQATSPGRGARFDYRLRWRGLPLSWKSEITRWDPPHCFADTQLSGPYRSWVHTHSFESHPHGTFCRDEVLYEVPGGKWIHRLLVENDLRQIFEYRQQKLQEIFSSPLMTINGEATS